MNSSFGAVVLASMLIAATPGAEQVLDFTQHYNVIVRRDIGELERDLNKAGQNGLRVVVGSTTGGYEVTLLLKKSKDGAPREYLVIAADDTTRLEQGISLGSSQGYRILPNTITSKSKALT
ncbi:MAG: hypothetical protein GY953_27885 [bacterium]|nr:hypothetical protein [bacterium]